MYDCERRRGRVQMRRLVGVEQLDARFVPPVLSIGLRGHLAQAPGIALSRTSEQFGHDQRL